MHGANEQQTSQNLEAHFPAKPYEWNKRNIALQHYIFLSAVFNDTTLYVVVYRASTISLCAFEGVTVIGQTMDQLVDKMSNFTWCVSVFLNIQQLYSCNTPMILKSKVILVNHFLGLSAGIEVGDKPMLKWVSNVPGGVRSSTRKAILWRAAGLFFACGVKDYYTHDTLIAYFAENGTVAWSINATILINKLYNYNTTKPNDSPADIGGFAVASATTVVVTVGRYFNSTSRIFLLYFSQTGDLVYNITSISSFPVVVSSPVVSANGTIYFVDSNMIYQVDLFFRVFLFGLSYAQTAFETAFLAYDDKHDNLWLYTNRNAGSALSLTSIGNKTVQNMIIYQCFTCGFLTLGLDNIGSGYFCVNDYNVACYVSPLESPQLLGSIGTVGYTPKDVLLANQLLIIPDAQNLIIVQPLEPDKDKSGKKYDKVIIIVSCVAVGALILICITFICVAFFIGLVRGKKGRLMTEDEKPLMLWLEENKERGRSLDENRVEKCAKISELIKKESWYIPLEELKIKANKGKLGGGASGNVYRVKWKGIDVALKTMIAGFWGSIDDFYDFSKEISLLSSIRHPNVVLFLGVTVEPNFGIGIVTEYCPRGSLLDFLQEDEPNITWDIIMKISVGTALGMFHLHSSTPPIIHRDIKPGNIVLLGDYTAKICDFGISCFVDEHVMYESSGTPLWCAPEIVQGRSVTTKVDVYSYGLTLWALLTRKPPTQRNISPTTLRPEIPEWCPQSYGYLISWCWAEDPEDRPTFWQILKHLQKKCIGDTENLPSSLLNPYMEKIQNIKPQRQGFDASEFDGNNSQTTKNVRNKQKERLFKSTPADKKFWNQTRGEKTERPEKQRRKGGDGFGGKHSQTTEDVRKQSEHQQKEKERLIKSTPDKKTLIDALINTKYSIN
eukprot:CAMPEP_0174256122 /NCGR_PEP_ID=MMETSP0439-20130205/5375_1 /TAXON_ID=0 /ORGANISM="Stereomyxa ramosa, Strain Chinc5" /LENGTH=895 /DNA_ID=CAMNT_0015338589 /DNA_START=158 /DNA_END=2845 /DNA_ORIENTATION=+